MELTAPLAEIVYSPYKKIIVHEIQEMTAAQFFETIVSNLLAEGQAGLTASVNWVDGIAFAIGFFPDTPEIVSEKVSGILHYGLLNFTRTSFQPEKKVSLNGREHIVRLNKVDKNPDFSNLARFLNNYK